MIVLHALFAPLKILLRNLRELGHVRGLQSIGQVVAVSVGDLHTRSPQNNLQLGRVQAGVALYKSADILNDPGNWNSLSLCTQLTSKQNPPIETLFPAAIETPEPNIVKLELSFLVT